ncbi:hypothetical protein DRQ11_15095, partial [candidate division KSB1 bacterium]
MISYIHRAKQRIKVRNILGYAVGLVIILFLIYVGGTNALKTAFNPLFLPLLFCFVSYVFLYLVSSFRWGFITNSIMRSKVCPYFNYFFYFMGAAFASQYIPRVGSDFLFRPGFLYNRAN